MMRVGASAIALAVLAGCAGQGYGTQWQPVVDLRPGQTQYYSDLAECQRRGEHLRRKLRDERRERLIDTSTVRAAEPNGCNSQRDPLD